MQFPKALNEQREKRKKRLKINYRFKGISLGLYRRGEGGREGGKSKRAK